MECRSASLLRILAVLLVGVGVAAGAVTRAEAQGTGNAAGTDAPRIAGCRIGFHNHYKVGYWVPIWVDLANTGPLGEPAIDITTTDSDGVATIMTVVPEAGATSHLAYTKIGRIGAPIEISLRDGDDTIETRVFDPKGVSDGNSLFDPLPAISELVLTLGGGASGLAETFPDRQEESAELARRVVKIQDVGVLPDRWYGYEGVNLVVVALSDGDFCRALAADSARLAALKRWVELGGRVVVLGEGEDSESLLTGPLASLLPGRYAESVETSEVTPLEHFADTGEPIARPGMRPTLRVPRLVEVDGVIAAYIGPRPTALPLVVRGPLGMGEATFAGVAVDSGPLAEWNGLNAFWRELLSPYLVDGEATSASQMLGSAGYNDLSGALRQRMGQSFPGVRVVAFSLVALFIVVYLALLGPASYWLSHHFTGRPAIAWILFPLLLCFASGGAYWFNQRAKGSQVRMNQLELVDHDATTKLVRGTYWGVVYSPQARQFDLELRVPTGGSAPTDRQTLLSWWGLPGAGIGGMQTSGLQLAAIEATYRVAASLDRLEQVPLLTASTKSFAARWIATAERKIEGTLIDDGGLVTGELVNRSPRRLRDVRLLYGTWAYRLGDMEPGRPVEIGEHLDPIKIQTLITQSARGAAGGAPVGRGQFAADRANAESLLAVMMFYRAAGGERFAGLPNRYQPQLDMSRLVELGRAVLIADADDEAAQLMDSAVQEPIGGDAEPRRTVHRYVLPVEMPE